MGVGWSTTLSGMSSFRKWLGHIVCLDATFQDVVKFHNAEAVETLRKTDGPFDIIFNDIDKDGYPNSLPVTKEKLRHGGPITIIDNMIWHGQTLQPNDHEESTEAIRRSNT